MKKPAGQAMKKPIRRAIVLEDLLSDFLDVEDVLLKIEPNNGLQPLTGRENLLYKEVQTKLRELIAELTNDVAQEHSAA